MIEISTRKIMADVKIRIILKGISEFKIRIWLAGIIFRLAGRTLGAGKANIEIKI